MGSVLPKLPVDSRASEKKFNPIWLNLERKKKKTWLESPFRLLKIESASYFTSKPRVRVETKNSESNRYFVVAYCWFFALHVELSSHFFAVLFIVDHFCKMPVDQSVSSPVFPVEKSIDIPLDTTPLAPELFIAAVHSSG